MPIVESFRLGTVFLMARVVPNRNSAEKGCPWGGVAPDVRFRTKSIGFQMAQAVYTQKAPVPTAFRRFLTRPLQRMFLTLLAAPLCATFLMAQEPVGTEPTVQPQSPIVGYDQLEIQANTFTSNRQQDGSVAADENGNLMVVWGSRRQEQGTFGIFAQFMDPRGRALSTEIHVNQYVPSEQAKPSVAFSADGTAWVLWHSVGQDGDGVGLYARRYGMTKNGIKPLGDEFSVNTLTENDQFDGVISAAPDGGVLCAWTGLENQRQVIHARHFQADGTPSGKEFRISEDSEYQENLVSLASSPQGVLAVWGRRNSAHSPEGIAGSLVSMVDGKPVVKEFAVVSGEEALEVEPSIDAAADGRFVVAWMSTLSGDEYHTMVQRYNADLTPEGEVLEVDAGGTHVRSGAQVAVAPDGRFLVAYNTLWAKQLSAPAHRPTCPTSIQARRFAADGTPMGEGFRLNQFNDGEQTLMVGLNAKHLLWTGKDQLVAAWHGNMPSDSRAVGLTMLVPEAFQPKAPAVIEPKAAGSDVTEDMVHGLTAYPDYDPNFRPRGSTPPPLASGGSGGFEAISNTGWTPPDPDLAVGPNHIVTVANGEISFHTKSGTRTFVDTIAGGGGFWGSVGAGGFVFDPVALFDPHTNRYIVAAADGGGTNDSIVLAMSDDDDPNGTWHKYRFPISSTCTFYDFPNLGVNEEAIFMAGDCFSGGGNRVFMWDKSLVMNGSPVTTKQVQTAGGPISLGATKNYDANSPAYFATTYSSSTSRIMLKAITDPNGTPVLTEREITVPGFSMPAGATQLGTSNLAATIDWRIKNGVVRNDHLWLSHNTGSSTAQVAWYEIDLNGWPVSGSNPSLVQSGTLDFGSGQHNWFGDINVTDSGDAVIAFNRSSSSQYISVDFASRKAGDPAGTFSAPKQLQISTSPETGTRWGDYSGVEQDPNEPGTFWNHHEYRTSGWRTWVGEFSISQDLTLLTPTLSPGTSVNFTAENAAVGESVYYLISLNAGTWAPPQLGGLALDLGTPATYLGSATANGSGTANLFVNIPGGAPSGVTAYIQVAARRGLGGVDSVKSNLVTAVIQ